MQQPLGPNGSYPMAGGPISMNPVSDITSNRVLGMIGHGPQGPQQRLTGEAGGPIGVATPASMFSVQLQQEATAYIMDFMTAGNEIMYQQVLPLRFTEALEIAWNEVHFTKENASSIEYMEPVRLLEYEQKSKSVGTRMIGAGVRVTFEALQTAEGRGKWRNSLLQLANAISNVMAWGGVVALLNAWNSPDLTIYRNQSKLGSLTWQTRSEHEVLNFARAIRHPDALNNVLADGLESMSAQGQSPNILLMDSGSLVRYGPGSQRTVNATEVNTMNRDGPQGPAAQNRSPVRDEISLMGVRLHQMQTFPVGSKQNEIDPSIRTHRIGEFFTMNSRRGRNGNIRIYDGNKDKYAEVSFAQALRRLHIWNGKNGRGFAKPVFDFIAQLAKHQKAGDEHNSKRYSDSGVTEMDEKRFNDNDRPYLFPLACHTESGQTVPATHCGKMNEASTYEKEFQYINDNRDEITRKNTSQSFALLSEQFEVLKADVSTYIIGLGNNGVPWNFGIGNNDGLGANTFNAIQIMIGKLQKIFGQSLLYEGMTPQNKVAAFARDFLLPYPAIALFAGQNTYAATSMTQKESTEFDVPIDAGDDVRRRATVLNYLGREFSDGDDQKASEKLKAITDRGDEGEEWLSKLAAVMPPWHPEAVDDPVAYNIVRIQYELLMKGEFNPESLMGRKNTKKPIAFKALAGALEKEYPFPDMRGFVADTERVGVEELVDGGENVTGISWGDGQAGTPRYIATPAFLNNADSSALYYFDTSKKQMTKLSASVKNVITDVLNGGMRSFDHFSVIRQFIVSTANGGASFHSDVDEEFNESWHPHNRSSGGGAAASANAVMSMHRYAQDFFMDFSMPGMRIKLERAWMAFDHSLMYAFAVHYLFMETCSYSSVVAAHSAGLPLPFAIMLARPAIQIRAATWFLAQAGASLGRTAFGYPTVTAQPDGATRSVVVSYTIRHASYVTNPYGVMPLDAMHPAGGGYQGCMGSEFFDSPKDFAAALKNVNESTPSLIPMIIGNDEDLGSQVSLTGSWVTDPLYRAYNHQKMTYKSAHPQPNAKHFSSADYYSMLYNMPQLFQHSAHMATLANRTKVLAANSVCYQGWQQYGDERIRENWGPIVRCAGHLQDAGSQPGAKQVWKGNESYLPPKMSIIEILATA